MGLKVTDIQDKNSQTREIQDKDWANRTSQNTINSTDFVLLEDTNGAYHKINRTSFADAVRDVLGSSINSAAKGTDIAKLPVLDSSNNLGMGTLANVASVLGGPLWVLKGSFSDTEWHSITPDNFSSGILFIGSQYLGYAIFNIAYNNAVFIGGREGMDSFIQVEGYQVSVKHCNYMLFTLNEGRVN